MQSARPRMVLIVEDNSSMRELLQQVLEEVGHQVVLAADRAAARRAWDASRADIDLVLTDVVLPDGPGTELADELVGERPDLPVLVMSGYDDADLPSDGRWRARGGSIRKPFDIAELIRRVDALLE